MLSHSASGISAGEYPRSSFTMTPENVFTQVCGAGTCLSPNVRGGNSPGPSERFFGLSFYRKVRRDRLGALRELSQRYGDVATFRVGVQRLVLLNHPDFVEDILVTRARLFKKGRALERAKRLLGEGLLTSEGDLHRRQRRLAQPAFHKTRIAGYAETMGVAADAAFEAPRQVAIPMRLRTESDGELAFITMIATFGTALDITLSELAIETFLPADHATSDALQRRASQ